MTNAWSVGADLRLQSGESHAGDESNQEAKLPGFTTVNLRTAYAIDSHFTLFGEIENLFDKRYYTYGAFAELDGLPPNFNLTNPRTYSPAPGRLLFAGLARVVDSTRFGSRKRRTSLLCEFAKTRAEHRSHQHNILRRRRRRSTLPGNVP